MVNNKDNYRIRKIYILFLRQISLISISTLAKIKKRRPKITPSCLVHLDP